MKEKWLATAGADAARALARRDNYVPPDSFSVRFTWDYRRARLLEKMLTESLDDFMSWPTVLESLHSGMNDVAVNMRGDLDESHLRAADFYQNGGISGTSIQQAWYLQQWEEFANKKVSELLYIHEFGGGYGAMSLMCRKLGFSGMYAIEDFPELHILQEYFLATCDQGDSFIPVSRPQFGHIDLYIALFSLSEVPPEKRIIPRADNYLIGYQPSWGEWDNRNWFSEWRHLEWDYDWLDIENPHFTNHRILIGVKRE